MFYKEHEKIYKEVEFSPKSILSILAYNDGNGDMWVTLKPIENDTVNIHCKQLDQFIKLLEDLKKQKTTIIQIEV